MESVVSENLRRMRGEKGLTQEQAAEKLGISAQAVSRWECATTMPDILLLPKIAQLYGVMVDDLFRKRSEVYENLAQRLAAVYEQSKDPEDFFRARQEFDRLFEKGGTSTDHWLYGMMHQQMMFFCRQQALEQMDILTTREEGAGDLYWKAKRQRIYLLSLTGGGPAALRAQQQAAQASQEPQEWLTLAAAYYITGDWENTVAWCMKTIRAAAEQDCIGLAYCYAGDACKQLEKYAQAFAHWEKAVAAGCMDAYFSMAFLHEELGEYARAYTVWVNITQTLEEKGYTEESIFPRQRAAKLRDRL